MGETVDEFRVKAISAHLWVEIFMNRFLTIYISKSIYNSSIEQASLLNDLILEKLSFNNKLRMVERIFKESYFNQSLPKIYKNKLILNKKKSVVEIIYDTNKSLKVNKLIKNLDGINHIRNHLVHRLVLDLNDVGTFTNNLLRNSHINMNWKGDEKQLILYKDYISFFSEKLEQIKQ